MDGCNASINSVTNVHVSVQSGRLEGHVVSTLVASQDKVLQDEIFGVIGDITERHPTECLNTDESQISDEDDYEDGDCLGNASHVEANEGGVLQTECLNTDESQIGI